MDSAFFDGRSDIGRTTRVCAQPVGRTTATAPASIRVRVSLARAPGTLSRGGVRLGDVSRGEREGDAWASRLPGSGEYVVVGGVRHVVPYEHDFISRCRRRARWRTRCSTTCGSRDRWRTTEPSGYARASRPSRDERTRAPHPVRARPSVTSRPPRPRVPTAADPPTTRLRVLLHPPRPPRPSSLTLPSIAARTRAGCRARRRSRRRRRRSHARAPPRRRRYPRRVVARPATLDLVVAADDWPASHATRPRTRRRVRRTRDSPRGRSSGVRG